MKKIEIDIVITRHQGLVDYLRQEGIIDENTQIVAHATPELIKDKNVLGVLPHSLSCLCRTFTEIPLNLPQELRGKELSSNDVRKYAGKPVTYVVFKLEK